MNKPTLLRSNFPYIVSDGYYGNYFPNSYKRFRENTFECTLGHPVDLPTCWGTQQTVQPRKQKWYQQQQHGVRTSDLHSTVTANRQREPHRVTEKDVEVLEIRVVCRVSTLLLSAALRNNHWLSLSSWLSGLSPRLRCRASVCKFT